ncbi:hypothetical protein AFLA_000542 [Aspergillus flavus NRRL3357]|nr:hypothetical protein AFLA_000542 [Aspergillus flavus NRRL3357]
MHDEVFAGLSGCPLCSILVTISFRTTGSSDMLIPDLGMGSGGLGIHADPADSSLTPQKDWSKIRTCIHPHLTDYLRTYIVAVLLHASRSLTPPHFPVFVSAASRSTWM